ncbi:amidase [Hyphomicrobium sp.]|jgi:Asp-tRNA(Asn)/Glu-tRNA(Gln) amidotransferase A subunit family amidase|uniref:amidase n=1 Tax=Hyphomicrobium sp. TaxID=82 RepID=UPI0035633EF1
MNASEPNGLVRLTALEAREALATGDLTSEELVGACLKRIAKRDAIRAWTHVDGEAALAAARASDAQRARGEVMGPLAGIPVGVKDIIDTKDFPTELGSEIFKGRQPTIDAFVVSELKAHGAIILGKTVTTEFAFFGPGETRNPHEPTRTPGGSSSGSAAAVADFQVPLALGTQTAGSIIRPASYCGVVGFKPTFGCVSRTGVLAQSAPLDTIGGYARSVEDVALLLDCIDGFDVADRNMMPGRKPSLLAQIETHKVRPRRLAFVKSPAWPQGDASMQAAFELFASTFKGDVDVIETALPAGFDNIIRLQQIVQFSDIARNYGPIADSHPGRVSAKLKEVIAEGKSFSMPSYDDARGKQELLYEALRPILVNNDVILTPAAQGVAPVGLANTGSPMFNGLWTYLGMPCLSLPLLTVDGMPLGVQLVGARGDGGRLLSIASWMMKERGRKSFRA